MCIIDAKLSIPSSVTSLIRAIAPVMPSIMNIHVECYSGYRGEEEPRRFAIGEGAQKRTIEVLEVMDRWLDPKHRYFKVKGSDQDTYILRHDSVEGDWDLTLFQKA